MCARRATTFGQSEPDIDRGRVQYKVNLLPLEPFDVGTEQFLKMCLQGNLISERRVESHVLMSDAGKQARMINNEQCCNDRGHQRWGNPVGRHADTTKQAEPESGEVIGHLLLVELL